MTETIDALQAQNGAYTLETVTPGGDRDYTVIRALDTVVPFEPGAAELVRIGSLESTRIISFTATEAGYYLDNNNQLDVSSNDVLLDLQAARDGIAGTTIYGALVAILQARRLTNAGPVTLLCCDNLRHNGDRSRDGLLQFIAHLNDSDLSRWVRENTTSPNCMVDRITPRPSLQVRDRVKVATGRDDGAALMAEDFIQWVIEDDFCARRPDWESVDAQMVSDVAPYEEAKIRILNASHSCIAWAGTLVGYEYIHEGAQDSAIQALAHAYVTDDVMPCLTPSPLDLANYRDVVLERFRNPAIQDTNQRVAMDGFSKIPGFIAPTIVERLSRGESIAAVSVLPVLFLAFLQRWHSNQLSYEYEDQSMDESRAHQICDAADPMAELVKEQALWGEITDSPLLLAALREASARVDQFLVSHTV